LKWLNAASHAYPLWKLTQEPRDGNNGFEVENIQFIAEKELVNHILLLEQCMFNVTSPGLCSLTFKVAELNNFPRTFNKDGSRWK
jgi:hypothetical protein